MFSNRILLESELVMRKFKCFLALSAPLHYIGSSTLPELVGDKQGRLDVMCV